MNCLISVVMSWAYGRSILFTHLCYMGVPDFSGCLRFVIQVLVFILELKTGNFCDFFVFFKNPPLLHAIEFKLRPLSKFRDTLPTKWVSETCIAIFKHVSLILSEIRLLKKYIWKMSIFLFSAYFNGNHFIYLIIKYINR